MTIWHRFNRVEEINRQGRQVYDVSAKNLRYDIMRRLALSCAWGFGPRNLMDLVGASCAIESMRKIT
jgi:hypothetical protein